MLLYEIGVKFFAMNVNCCRKDFIEYADVCFKEFGDRVQYWTTVNEPNIFGLGYDQGIVPPRRCSPPFGLINCTRGNSSTEPYLVLHHILLAHASVVRLYRKNYQVLVLVILNSLILYIFI